MACLICDNPVTIKAHLIPRAFAIEVKSAPGEKQVIAHPGRERFSTNNTGRFDPDILCGDCDGMLGKHEGAAHRLLKKVREAGGHPGQFVHAASVDGDGFVRFCAGVAWKYCVTKPTLGRIDVGPYVDHLREAAFGASIPPSIDATALRLFTGGSDVSFYREPLPDRIGNGVNAVRFSVGAFVVFLKIDRRGNPSVPPSTSWLRGKTSADFPVLPAALFEEWNKHIELMKNERLRNYLVRGGRATAG
jgi:hypothetical protein